MEKTAHKRTSVHKEHAETPKTILLELEGAVIPIGFVKVSESQLEFSTSSFVTYDTGR